MTIKLNLLFIMLDLLTLLAYLLVFIDGQIRKLLKPHQALTSNLRPATEKTHCPSGLGL